MTLLLAPLRYRHLVVEIEGEGEGERGTALELLL